MPYKTKRKNQKIKNSKLFCIICSIKITKRGRPIKGKSEIKPNENLIPILSSISQSTIISAEIESEIKENDENLTICHSCESFFEKNQEICEKIKLLQNEHNKIKLEIKELLKSSENGEFSKKNINLRKIISNALLDTEFIKKENDEKIGYDLPLDIILNEKNENKKNNFENEKKIDNFNVPLYSDELKNDDDDTDFEDDQIDNDYELSVDDEEDSDNEEDDEKDPDYDDDGDDNAITISNSSIQPSGFRNTRANSQKGLVFELEKDKDEGSEFYSLFGTDRNQRKTPEEKEANNIEKQIIKMEPEEISEGETDDIQPLFCAVFPPEKKHGKCLRKCFLCNVTFGRDRSLLAHVRQHNNTTCHLCKTKNPEFPNIKEYKSHIAKCHPNKCKYKCEICGKATRNSQALIGHKNSVHFKTQLNLKCDLCDNGVTYKSSQGLNAHKRTKHFRNEKILCPICGKELASTPGYTRHMMTVHEKKEENKFKCDLCDYFTFEKHYLRIHKDVHCETRNYLCSECGAAFKSEKSLGKHQKRKHKTPRFNCEKCGQGYQEKEKFNCHLFSHKPREEWPFVCRHCPKRFYSKYKLGLHETLHSGVRDIICDICQKARFSTNSGLYTHKYIVHKIRTNQT